MVTLLKYCPYCGAGLEAEMTFCPKCGQRFVDANSGAAQKRSSHSDDVHEFETNSDKANAQSSVSRSAGNVRSKRRPMPWLG